METYKKSRNSITPRRFGGAGVVFLFIFFTAGCGIPDYAYLEPPTAVILFNKSNYASFSNTTNNDPDIFQGYEIYGKFYSSDPVDSGNIETQRALVNNGFRKLATPLEIEDSWRYSPLIKLTDAEKDDSIVFVFDFSGDNPGPPIDDFNTKIAYNEKEVLVARFLNSASPLKNFSEDDLVPEDKTDDPVDGGDLPSDFPPDIIGELFLYLSVYVVSYGTDFDLSPVYSEPCYLGVVELAVDELKW